MDLNILLRGQSNAGFFDEFGGFATLQADVQRLLGFDGVRDKVNLIGGEHPDAAGWVAAFGGTSLLPPFPDHWLDFANGADPSGGFTPGSHEQSLLNYIADLSPAERATPTAVLFMHNESDSFIPGSETTAEWTAAVRYDAGLVRSALGQDAATVPYLFVPVPFDSSDPATMQAIRLGQEELSADPAFNGAVATHTGDVDMDNPVNGLPAGTVIYGGPHLNQADVALLAARIAPSIADSFAAYARPGSPVALAHGHVDDSGPQAIRVDWVPATPTQVIVTLAQDPSATGLMDLGTQAAVGLGWTIRDGNASLSASSAQILPGSQLRLTFAQPVPTDAGARLFYDYGTGRLAVGADTHTGAGYPGTGPGFPGAGNGIYDSNGLPAWASAAGLTISGGAARTVGDGAATSGATLFDGDTLSVQSGGAVLDVTALTGGTLTVASGGTASATAILGGTAAIAGVATGTTISAGVETVQSGGTEAGATVLAGGTLTVEDGGLLAGTFQDMGEIVFALTRDATTGAVFDGTGALRVTGEGTLTLTGVSSLSGTVEIGSNSTLNLVGAHAAGVAPIVFTGTGGRLLLDATRPGPVISGFTPGSNNMVQLRGLAGTPAIGRSGDVITLGTGNNAVVLDIAGSNGRALMFTPSNAGDGPSASLTISLDPVPCYCPGTHILTPGGEIRIERLKAGDLVTTVSGKAKPILWVGRRSYAAGSIRGRRDLLPVCIAAGALGDGMPRRDLHVSPQHALLLDGLLVPARDLVDGTLVTQAAVVDRVEYIHIELDTHDAVFAEGAPAETYLDEGHRAMFTSVQGGPSQGGAASGYCAPRARQGHALQAIRRRIAMGGGWRPLRSLPEPTLTR